VREKIIRSLRNIKPEHRGGVLTIGNFDGVHLGHQQLLQRTIDEARKVHGPAIVITFEPHAFEFFAKDKVTIPRLTRLREKCCALLEYGADYVLILPFNHDLAKLTASEFVTQVLHESLQPKHIAIGDDFHFGKERQGNYSLLSEMGRTLGFTVEALPTVMLDGVRVSSTRVRKALAEGDHDLANRLLGRPYSMLGKIRHGDKLGRQLGFPTANLWLHRKLTPVRGVYTVLMHGIEKYPLQGVANVGTRPTVDGTRTLLEVHLLAFDQDIYGRHVKVEFCKKLRDEERYASLDILKDQIAKDVEVAREFFLSKKV
jgi:riboflavin kinase/FMN adenylyltransferase